MSKKTNKPSLVARLCAAVAAYFKLRWINKNPKGKEAVFDLYLISPTGQKVKKFSETGPSKKKTKERLAKNALAYVSQGDST